MLLVISRAAYRYWKSRNWDSGQIDTEARKWAEEFNALLSPHFSVKVASPGLPKEPRWMSYKPGPPPNVVEALSWAVLGPNKIALKLANVL